jgi:predicted nuclease of predicted toxin-antitoxin system
MKFLSDQDVYIATVRFLTSLGHDVVTAAQSQLSQADDVDLLVAARKGARILLTRDRDFGSLVFVQGVGAGVIYLRMLPATIDAVHAELENVLRLYPEHQVLNSFVVVEPGRHRIRRIVP